MSSGFRRSGDCGAKMQEHTDGSRPRLVSLTRRKDGLDEGNAELPSNPRRRDKGQRCACLPLQVPTVYIRKLYLSPSTDRFIILHHVFLVVHHSRLSEEIPLRRR